MIKLGIPPDKDSYSVIPGSGTLMSETAGGPARFRRDYIGEPASVSLKWTVGVDKYNYLMAFYRTGTVYGSQPFRVDLIIDGAALQEYIAHFIPKTLKLNSHTGLTYVVIATLEVLTDGIDHTDEDNQVLAEYDSL